MRAYRARKNPKPKRTTIIDNQPPSPQPQPVQAVQKQQPAKQQPKAREKAPQQLQQAPQQVVKDFEPLYKLPNAQPLSDNSIATYLSQF
jgi:hypothetical protein